ncbi:class I lanthipeptide [Spirosoma gilvum]
MKKQFAKITLKTDKIVSLSKSQAQHVAGGMRAQTKFTGQTPYCPGTTGSGTCVC